MPSELTATIIDSLPEWEKLEDEWKCLFEASPTASPPLQWEWLHEWWRVYGPAYSDPSGGLRVVALRQGSQLVGALPLYFSVPGPLPFRLRKLGFLASGEAAFEETCSDYLDLLHAPGMESACIDALAALLLDSSLSSWDELDLHGMSGSSPLLQLQPRYESGGKKVHVEPMGQCYLSNCTDGFDAYLQRLSSDTRKQARKLLRAAESAGMIFETATDEETAMRFFDEMVELHQARWATEGKSGCFAPRHQEFHRCVTRRLLPQGGALLARLSWEGRVYAVLHGYRVGAKVDLYHQGVLHETHPVRSPGAVGTLMLIQHLADRGCTHLDHLAGLNTFKKNYSTEERPLVGFRAFHPSLRLFTSSTTDLAFRAGRKALKLLRGSRNGSRGGSEAESSPSPIEAHS